MDSIVFKGRKDRISVMFNDKNKNFEQLQNDFEQKLEQTQNFFDDKNMCKDIKTSIEFLGHEFSQNQKVRLLNVLTKKTGLKLSLFSLEQKPNTELKTLFHKSSLRSGQSICYDGNVIILGDINPGAEVIAVGSIIVMGAIRSLVHAGCSGDKTSIISALSIAPVQLRIADIITCIPEGETVLRPSYACVDNNKLYISPL